MTRGRFSKSAGMTLLEMLVALALLVFFMFVAGQLFTGAFNTAWNAEHYQDKASRTESAIRQLRIDCWNARKIQATDNTAQFDLARGTQVKWEIEQDGSLLRSADAKHIVRWQGTRISGFSTSDGHCLIVSESAPTLKRQGITNDRFAPASIALESQIIWQERMR